jgi:PKD repeat protein
MKRIIIALVVSSASISAQTVSFLTAPGSPIPNSGGQMGYLAKDLNNDGKKDLIVGSAYGSDLYVYMGLGTGQFSLAPGSPISGMSGPISTASDDFNGDGTPDLATAHYNSGNLTIMIGNGNGSFTQSSGSPYFSGTNPYCVDVADFNMDGKKDVIVSNANSHNVRLFLGNGLGGFSLAPGFPVATATVPYHVTAGFFNSDAFPDFAVANGYSNNLQVFLNNGSGGFTQASGSPYPTGNRPRTIAQGDINGDGAVDLVVSNALSDDISIYFGSSTGAFTQAGNSPISTGIYPFQIIMTDFNLDGNRDIGVVCYGSNGVYIYYCNGTGGFSLPAGSPVMVGNGPHPMCTDDFNGDGKADLAVGDWSGSDVHILINSICGLSPSITSTPQGSGAFQFTANTGTVAANSYSWSFGDGGLTGSGAQVSHVYATSGTYSVVLTVSNGSCSSTSTHVVSVCVVAPAFTYSMVSGGLVTFQNNSGGTNPTATYSWSFGDGSSTTGTPAAHSYSTGTYTVTLYVSHGSPSPCFGSTTQVISICNLNVTATKTVGTGGTVQFTGSSGGTTSASSYTWHFGDGTSATGWPLTTHTYSQGGMYTATVTAFDPNASSCTRTFTLTVLIPEKVTAILNELRSDVSFYPNPSAGWVRIGGLTGEKRITMRLIDLTGALVYQKPDISNYTGIDLSHLPPGLYIYQLTDETGGALNGQLAILRE